VVATNLGHSDTRMVEKHYGHLAADYVAREIRKAAPRFHLRIEADVISVTRQSLRFGIRLEMVSADCTGCH